MGSIGGSCAVTPAWLAARPPLSDASRLLCRSLSACPGAGGRGGTGGGPWGAGPQTPGGRAPGSMGAAAREPGKDRRLPSRPWPGPPLCRHLDGGPWLEDGGGEPLVALLPLARALHPGSTPPQLRAGRAAAHPNTCRPWSPSQGRVFHPWDSGSPCPPHPVTRFVLRMQCVILRGRQR